MSTTSRAAVVSAAVAAMLTVLAPAGYSDDAAGGPGAGLPREVRACVRPVQTPAHSADVVQAWIDGCRRTVGERSSR